MIRILLLAAGLSLGLSGAVHAQPSDSSKAKTAAAKAKAGAKPAAQADDEDEKPAAKGKASGKGAAKAEAGKGKGKSETGKAGAGKPGKPVLSGAFGDWGAYVSQGAGKAKTCYALAKPKSRSGAGSGAGFIFIATRPAENVRGEISIMLGAPLKEGAAGGSAEIGQESFALVAKGQNAWVKDTAEEKQLADAMRKGARLVVKAPTAKGGTITDSYALTGLGQALDQVRKDCN